MTTPISRSLLEEFVDNELSEKEAERVRRALEESPELKSEYEATVQLKTLLSRQRTPDPGAEYWDEVTDLISARVEEPRREEVAMVTSVAGEAAKRRAFFRSLISAAAALFLFFSAVFLGTSRQQQALLGDASEEPVLLTAELARDLYADREVVMTESERTSTTLGMFLLGSPGHVGRFSGLPELMNGR
jgi:anti-sigma factor RsiW